MKNRYVAFGIYIVVFILFWNLLDLMTAKFIYQSSYSFKAGYDLFAPLATAIVTGYFAFLRER